MSAAQSSNTSIFRTYRNDFHESGKKLFLDPETADVHFSFGSGETSSVQVPAHKNLLAAKSDVFKAMFYGKLKEATTYINITDTYEAAFMEFLQYFHLSEVKLSAEHIETVLYLGNKYNVKNCVADCVQFLIKLLNNENVCDRLHLAILHEQKELMKVCEKQIFVYTAAVLKSEGFLACDQQVLEHILRMSQLSCSEVEVFEAVMSWVKAKSKQNVLSKELVESHLGNELFHEIHFASMKIEEFCTLANKYDSVLSSYHRTITNMIVLPHLRNEELDEFNTRSRLIEWNKDAIVKCKGEQSEIGWGSYHDLSAIETIKFASNVPLLLGSFKCVDLNISDDYYYLRPELMVDVKIYELQDAKCKTESGNLLLEMKAELNTEGSTVSLPHPIVIRPEFFYSIEIGPFPEGYYIFNAYMEKQVKLEGDSIIKFYDEDTYDDDDDVGSEGLMLELDFNRI